ncbi:hypothetical protein [Flavobacterium orientale]|uniref:Uncharacterized protein n=1 Tax=Flavobacterium orientale TaxID=1756020 RepID=A0A916YB67_9FLAO|nr:hypothetical protein [Flavobacterium orientale]GGD36417.1 hypothetical protein GCM10011343_27860 [Flavobacterium orientale]
MENSEIAQKIKKYHSDEIRLILFICATDLTKYSDDELVNFTEDIEGRIEVLFEPTFLSSISDYIQIDKGIIKDFHKLRNTLTNLYSSQWHKKMKDNKTYWFKVNNLSLDILQKLRLNYIEPLTFIENNFEVDWIYEI